MHARSRRRSACSALIRTAAPDHDCIHPTDRRPHCASGSPGKFDIGDRVVYNGEVSEVETSKDFEKLDLIAKVAFELSFLGFIPSNPMFGLTMTRSEFDGFNQKVTNDSFGFAFSFATPPE